MTQRKRLRKKVMFALMGAFLASSAQLFPVDCIDSTAYAATKVELETDSGTKEDFDTRIQRILDEMHNDDGRGNNRSSNYDKFRNAPVHPPEDSNGRALRQIGGSGAVSRDSNENEEQAPTPPPPEDEDIPDEAPPQSPPQASRPAAQIPAHQAPVFGGEEKRLTFDWRGTPLAQSIYGVAKVAGMGCVINTEVDGSVYCTLKGVTCKEALDYLGRAFNFNWMIENGNILVTKDDKMKQSTTYDIDYADGEKVVEELKALGIESSSIYSNSEQGTISVTGTPWELREARRRLDRIDQPISQVMILAQLIEISHGRDVNLGLRYELPSYTHAAGDAYTNIGQQIPFSITLLANKELAKGKVIARPMVMLLNGETGTVSFGDQVPILSSTSTSASTTVSIEYKDVGTNLTVTPNINKRTGEVKIKMEVEVSNITNWVTTGGTRAPQIATRKATTSAHVLSGESFLIGGLMSDRDIDSLVGIPGLMDLPILGNLFKYHSRNHSYGEVYIMVTPYIISDNIDPMRLVNRVKEDAVNPIDDNKKSKK